MGYENVYFFEAKNFNMLANLMINHINDVKINDNIVNQRIKDNKKEYGRYLLDKIENVIIDSTAKD